MTKEILNDRAFFLLKTLGFYEDFVAFDKLIIIREAKRVFKGGYEEELIRFKMHKKKIDQLRKRLSIKDYVSILQNEVEKIKKVKAIKGSLFV